MTEQELTGQQGDNEDKVARTEASSDCCSGESAPSCCAGGANAGIPPCKSGTGLKLLLLVLFSAILGFMVTANWYKIKLNAIFAEVEITLGMLILASVVFGFFIGLIFLWSVCIGER